MAIIIVMGNTPAMPEGILEFARSLPANIALEMSFATGVHAGALCAIGVVFLAFASLFINREIDK